MSHPLLARFASKVAIDPTGCWVWEGCLKRSGHGQFNDGAATVDVHRFIYTMLVGGDVSGRDIHHLCENPRCVNPSHLVALTRRHHIAVSPKSKGHAAIAHNRCAQGHPLTGSTTGVRPNGLRYCRICSTIRTRKKYAQGEDRRSPFLGVYWHKASSRWKVHITHGRRYIHIGTFSDEREAAAAWNKKAIELRGTNTRLNPV